MDMFSRKSEDNHFYYIDETKNKCSPVNGGTQIKSIESIELEINNQQLCTDLEQVDDLTSLFPVETICTKYYSTPNTSETNNTYKQPIESVSLTENKSECQMITHEYPYVRNEDNQEVREIISPEFTKNDISDNQIIAEVQNMSQSNQETKNDVTEQIKETHTDIKNKFDKDSEKTKDKLVLHEETHNSILNRHESAKISESQVQKKLTKPKSKV